MDAPFPDAMMPCIRRFFRDVHPTLEPGRDSYQEVFDADLFFPLQRKRELERMIRIAREVGREVCDGCQGNTGTYTDPDSGDVYLSDPGGLQDTWRRCDQCEGTGKTGGPKTVIEIGADKGGGLYHWCMSLPTVKRVIACEVRGTPYAAEFEMTFPDIEFLWLPESSYEATTLDRVLNCFGQDMGIYDPIDVLFIDGDKTKMVEDFHAYLPLMRQPGGVVFIHDVSDREPREAFHKIVYTDRFKTEVILDRSEGLEAAERDLRGEKPRNSHDQWLMQWRGRSCGVGVIRL